MGLQRFVYAVGDEARQSEGGAVAKRRRPVSVPLCGLRLPVGGVLGAAGEGDALLDGHALLGGMDTLSGPAYDLYGVVSHEGPPDDGHYVASVLCGHQWWRFDDSNVTVVAEGMVVTPDAYLLFYLRRNADISD